MTSDATTEAVNIPTKADLEKLLAQVEAETPSDDRDEAIAKIKEQIAHLPTLHAALAVPFSDGPAGSSAA